MFKHSYFPRYETREFVAVKVKKKTSCLSFLWTQEEHHQGCYLKNQANKEIPISNFWWYVARNAIERQVKFVEVGKVTYM
jgi:hypothetical protein